MFGCEYVLFYATVAYIIVSILTIYLTMPMQGLQSYVIVMILFSWPVKNFESIFYILCLNESHPCTLRAPAPSLFAVRPQFGFGYILLSQSC